ncbi:MAG: hypothetical protein HKN12_09330, partial [Gemmatimonadetes bacterium]|nr:hypothetical protein [Gemmatimonadota bacterium]
MARKRKKSQGSLRARALLGILTATVAVMLGIALTTYLMDENWRLGADELVFMMGRLNFLTASALVTVLGVMGAWLVPVGLAALSLRLFVGRPL